MVVLIQIYFETVYLNLGIFGYKNYSNRNNDNFVENFGLKFLAYFKILVTPHNRLHYEEKAMFQPCYFLYKKILVGCCYLNTTNVCSLM